jgi:hypothetical protein
MPCADQQWRNLRAENGGGRVVSPQRCVIIRREPEIFRPLLMFIPESAKRVDSVCFAATPAVIAEPL